MSQARTAFFFVVDGARLEAMSCLLAATLRHYHPDPDVSLIAYATDETEAALAPRTRALYARCGVTLRPLNPDPKVWRRPYPHGNKLFAAAAKRDADLSIFFDTDTVCVAPLPLDKLRQPGTVAAVPEGLPTWGKGTDRWARAYAHIGQELPTERVRLTRGKQIEFYPYYNAGFVAMPEAEIAPGLRFGQAWLEMAQDVDWTCPVAQKRPWLDQITLPLTIAKHGLNTTVLPEAYNFGMANRRRTGGAKASMILHYHRARFLDRIPQYLKLLDILADALPDPMRDLTAILDAMGGPEAVEAWAARAEAA